MQEVINKPIRIYLGGKIGKNDWRHKLFGPTIPDNDIDAAELLRQTLKSNRVHVEQEIAFQYAGPFFMGCDHGCYHYGGNHALGIAWPWEYDNWVAGDPQPGCGGSDTAGPISRRDAVHVCETWLDSADLMVVWACDEFHTAHGTHVEMGYARAKGIHTILMVDTKLAPEYIRQWWFAAETADTHIFADDPISGFKQLCRDNNFIKTLPSAKKRVRVSKAQRLSFSQDN